MLYFIVFLILFYQSRVDAKDDNDISNYLNLSRATSTTVKIIKVKDGDTVVVDERILNNFSTQTVRLLGVNTPEIGEFYYEEAKNFLERFKNKEIYIYLSNNKDFQYDIYNRLLGVLVYKKDNMTINIINKEILEGGYGRRCFWHNDILNWDIFEEVEVDARHKKLGIWTDLGKKGIFITEIHPAPPQHDFYTLNELQFIELCNTSNEKINLAGWYMKMMGSSRDIRFEDPISICPGEYILIARYPEKIRKVYSLSDEVKIIKAGINLKLNPQRPPGGLDIYLYDDKKIIQDALVYNLAWDNYGACFSGYTQEKINIQILNIGDSNVGGVDDANWQVSRILNGTPGRKNSASKDDKTEDKIIIVYPNPYIETNGDNLVNFSFNGKKASILIYDISGELVAELEGEDRLSWKPPRCGIYIYVAKIINNKKIIIDKIFAIK